MFYVGDFEILACHTGVQKPFTSSFIQYKLHEANVEAQTLVWEAIGLDGLEKLFSVNAYEKWLPEGVACLLASASSEPTDEHPVIKVWVSNGDYINRACFELYSNGPALSGVAEVGPKSPQLLMPGPHDQLSKPGAGGYSLREVLKWDQSLYHTAQPEDICMLIKTMVQHNFPSLKQYQDAWPAADFSIIFLKNTSSARW
ncbi:hypothetical protein F5J12DRAFT_786860 [Pisolithus orientalis]|uniref:uncharacterized protein n=1 Tax=Pisolithus orientalis TaxID=936130 RepID=UPI00222416A3|nr:uncharacterized protein F5J12DRAFT_786860 [Pisolithus orientalis]KAI5988464.1 hypothetical protein F5J12DRAFT_786860 [Pisolithus orientalis]